jgi:hypothetical protein
MRIRKTELRERRWRRLKEATGEETVAGALDGAAKHYLTDLRKKQKVVDNLDGERVEELSTAFMPMDRESRVERE